MAQQKISVVTGASSGIGKWIALGMAQAGYAVVMVGRDPARGDAAKFWILERVPSASLDLRVVDLASLEGTAALARDIAAVYGRVDVLVLNAGMFQSRHEVTSEGHESVLAVNHLSPFVMIRELAGALRAAAPSRIVVVGSSSSDNAKIDLENVELTQGWGMWRSYSRSKLAVMMATFEWARRLAAERITANVVHPGFVASGLVRTPGLIGLVWRLGKPFGRSEEKGAETPLFVALSPEHGTATGKYFKDCKIVQPNRLALDEALCRQLWQATERLAG
jgi:NAD(P)-dependent dehydrogenase (short-subunit alcohol dehydrogenase family)